MKVLIINNFYYPNVLGGAEISVQTLAEYLVRLGVDVTVLALSGNKEDERFVHNGVNVIAIGRPRFGSSPTVKRRPKLGRLAWQLSAAMDGGLADALGRVIDEINPDVVNSFNLAGLTTVLWSAVKARGLPLIHTLFGTYLVCFRGPMFRSGRDCKTQCRDCGMLTSNRLRDSALVDVVVGDSGAVLDRHLYHNYFPLAKRKLVINCGFERNDSVPVRDHYTGPLRIGFIGRLHPTKGVNVLLEAARMLPADGWAIKVGGTGEAHYELELKTLAPDAVEFLGWQHTPTFLSGIDVLVVPSIWNDPLPRAVFEGFCAGVPVIGSDIGGIPEMIVEGENGYLFTPGSALELAECLKRVIAEPELVDSMRSLCLMRSAHFSSKRFANDYITLYEEVLQ